MKNNLCLFCGGKHRIADCDKRKNSENARGRAATVGTIPTSDPRPDPKAEK